MSPLNISTMAWQYDYMSLVNYVNRATEVLAKYSWVYNVRNTHILVDDVLRRIPLEWSEALADLQWEELRQIPFRHVKEEWPATLKSFVKECCCLAEMRFPEKNLQSEIENQVTDKWLIEKKTPSKKQEEIKIMSYLLNETCKDVMCDTVLDVGSGLGYLEETLHRNFGLKCIGLDSSACRTSAAKKRLENDPCQNYFYYKTMTVENTEECAEEIRIHLKNSYNILECNCQKLEYMKGAANLECDSAVMTGLHCCGNLMQNMMKLFLFMDELKAFVCVGCCYNKIPLNEFPMSQAAKNAVDKVCIKYPNWLPCISGLRLGTQGTRSELPTVTEDMLLCRSKAILFRAVLQCYTEEERVNWQTRRMRIKLSHVTDFETYCKDLLRDDLQGEAEYRVKELNDMYSKKEYYFPLIKILLILQDLLQPVWECFVTVDRILFFEENSISTKVLSLWNDLDSPRNIAICGYKRGGQAPLNAPLL